MLRENVYEFAMTDDRFVVYIDTASRPGWLQTGEKFYSHVAGRELRINVREHRSLQLSLQYFYRLCDRIEGQGCRLVRCYS